MNPAAPPFVPHNSRLRWWVCILLMLATVINYMDRMALNQMALRMQRSLGMDDQQYSLLESAFSLAFAIGAVATGFLVDRTSVRWVYPFMVLGWSAAGVLTGFASSFMMLLACRFMLGLFEAGNWPCGIRTTRTVLKPEERSFGNSLFQSGTALGAVVTPLIVLALLAWADPGAKQRTGSMAVVGGTYAATDPGPSNAWQFPFRVIGCLGLVWVALWFLTIPKRMLKPAEGDTATQGAINFRDVFLDKRFWVLLAMVVAINVTWHGYRTWLPLYLQKQRGFTEAEMARFTTAYYLIADVGSWTVGLLTLWMCSRGRGVHSARILAFCGCAGLTLCSVAVPFLPNGTLASVSLFGWKFSITPLEIGLLAVAFGALGLFPTYFAFSQELSSKHQGKVTGTLGASAHIALALIYPIEGFINKRTGTYEYVLGGIGVFPLLALALMLWKWRK